MSELDAIFEIRSERRLFHKMRDWIFEHKCRPMEAYASYSPRLSEAERHVILAWGFVAETTNGGLHQFLTNSTGDHAEETRAMMHKIGAKLASDGLDAIHKVFFSNQPIPSDRAVRNQVLSEWEAKHGEKVADEFLDKFDQQLGWCESVDDAIAQYIREHRKMFS
jgi:hypothetical protein